MPDLQTARSLLFAPGDDERKLVRALSSGADAVIADLEDAVADVAKACVSSASTGTARPGTTTTSRR
jgi:citrate lyase beta subunit